MENSFSTVSEFDFAGYYMGKNTEERQRFIIDNLRIEKDEVNEVEEELAEA